MAITMAAAATEAAAASPAWSQLLLAVLGSSVAGGLLTTALGSLRASAEVRRDGYARATSVLVRRTEYAYRVRRRTSDDPATLAELTHLGSEIQEELAWCRAWVAAESAAVSAVFDGVCSEISQEASAWLREAWTLPPVSRPTEMNLGEWGPRAGRDQIARFQSATRFRFGWRRTIPAWIVKRWLRRKEDTSRSVATMGPASDAT
ncbi:hypothetical protein [Sanguibacter massiliensis]|uniref:hypothetical protein n=1 Tax=Sanguibacter massiliensis TaxID=1973217 RepID=UPI00101ADE15|nr:hypothetical protein [Sanguibacter massiliensis]